MGAGVVRIKGTDRALAMSVDGNGRYCYLDPSRGAMLAVAEAARNVACAGAPSARRDQLPELRQPRAARDHVAVRRERSRASARRAARSACRSPAATSASTTRPTARAIYPTPVIGIVGLLEHADRVVGRRFQGTGDVVVLLGDGRGELGGSEYLKVVHDLVRGVPPALDLAAERALQKLLVGLADERLIRSAHDCSDGGLAVTLAECCFDTGGIGAEASVDAVDGVANDERLNARPRSSANRRRASSCRHRPIALTAVLARAAAAGVPARVIGQTGGNRLRIAVGGGEVAIDRVRGRGRARVVGGRSSVTFREDVSPETCSTSSRTNAASSASSVIPKRPT